MLRHNLYVIGIVFAGVFIMFIIMMDLPTSEIVREPVRIETAVEAINFETEEPIVLTVGASEFQAYIAATPQARMRGLSRTVELPQNSALLFVFDQSNHWGIWMKDMNYPLDIVWLNDMKEVVHIETEVSPDTYPNQFAPLVPARYVLEFNAGTVEEIDLTLSDSVVFTIK